MLQRAYCGIASDGGKIVEKFIQGLTGFQILQQGLERHPGSAKNRRPAKNIGIADIISLRDAMALFQISVYSDASTETNLASAACAACDAAQ